MPALARDQYTRNKIFISSSSIYKLHIYKIDITALTYEFVNDLKATLKQLLSSNKVQQPQDTDI